MKEWFRIAGSASVRRRALGVAAVVGSILLAINHGDAILRGNFSPDRLVRMALTLIVPYLVSTFSSVGAILELQRTGQEASATRPDPDPEALDRLAS
jgi:hypothetical protein